MRTIIGVATSIAVFIDCFKRSDRTVSLMETRGGPQRGARSEVFRGLSMDPNDGNFVQTIVNNGFSGLKLVRVTATGNLRPLQTRTVSGVLNPFLAITAAAPQVSVATTSKVECALELLVARRGVSKESRRDGRIVYSSAQNGPPP